MKLFREETEYRRERARSTRFGGWGGLFLYLALLLVILYFAKSFTSESVQRILWFISGGKT